ncbi:SPW repeat protein [Streptomyces sp. NPDC058525]|uniref:SPW repeat domain-containing protein n=1 Tax=unclassified Streptomyces TaxID=2593676 RepID=UPI003664AD61
MTRHSRRSAVYQTDNSPPESRRGGPALYSLVSFLMLLVGIWLLVGAWVIGYPFNEPAVDAHLNEMIVGVVVFLVALARLLRRRGPVSDLIIAVAGAWLIVAPFVIGYGGTSKADAARINEVATGIVLILLAAVSLLAGRTRRA